MVNQVRKIHSQKHHRVSDNKSAAAMLRCVNYRSYAKQSNAKYSELS